MKHLSGVDKTLWCNYELSLHAIFSPRCYYVLHSAHIRVFFCVCSVHQNKAASDQLKISYFSPNRSSPRENSPKPCLNRATQLGNRLSWWALSQIPNLSVCFLSRSTYANIQQCTTPANGLTQTFHGLTFKSFALYMREVLRMINASTEPRQTWNNFSQYTRSFQNSQMGYWMRAVKQKLQKIARGAC